MKTAAWLGLTIYLRFSKKHKLKLASIEDLISYRLKMKNLLLIVYKQILIKKFGF